MEKLKKVSRIEVLNIYRTRYLMRLNKGLPIEGWYQVLNNVEAYPLDYIEIGKIFLPHERVIVIFIGEKNILGCIEFSLSTPKTKLK